MNQIALTFALSLSVIACAISAYCLWLALQRRAQANEMTLLTRRFEEEINALNRNLPLVLERAAAQTVAKTVARATAAAPQPPPPEEELLVLPDTKPTMTERRRRVLALARRGQDADTISNMLGMPNGEVELIMNLSAI